MRGGKVTKSHAGGVLVLVFVILAMQISVYLFTLIYRDAPNLRAVNSAEVVNGESKELAVKSSERFAFDPNLLTADEFMKLGFSRKQAESIVKYRSRVGGFRKREDFSKLYVVSDSIYEELKEYITIKPAKKSVFRPVDQLNPKKEMSGSFAKAKSDTVKIADKSGEPSAPVNYRSALKEIASAKSELLDLNSADSAQLVSLPGIGPYFASKIVDYRNRLGGYAFPEQLMDIYGLDESRLNYFKRRVYTDTSQIKKLDLKSAGEREMAAHPYIGGYVARGIVRFRERMGEVSITLDDLVINKIVKSELAGILRFYFR